MNNPKNPAQEYDLRSTEAMRIMFRLAEAAKDTVLNINTREEEEAFYKGMIVGRLVKMVTNGEADEEMTAGSALLCMVNEMKRRELAGDTRPPGYWSEVPQHVFEHGKGVTDLMASKITEQLNDYPKRHKSAEMMVDMFDERDTLLKAKAARSN